ncbi:unnamed protein product, partial [Arabidopsis halleri]
ISVIASGIGEPLHTEKSRLDPVNIGVTKVKVVIKLDSHLPSTVVVRDVQGNTSRVAVEYPRPPPKCLNCGRYGHLLSRCPKPLMKKLPFKNDTPSGSKEVSHPSVILPSSVMPGGSLGHGMLSSVVPTIISEASSSKAKRRRSRSKRRARSTPPRIGTNVDGRHIEDEQAASGLRWVMKPVKSQKGPLPADPGIKKVVCSAISIPSNSELISTKSSQEPTVLDTEDGDRPKVPSVPAVFPIPPGWEDLTKKARKKLQKIWHNQMRSQAQAFARGDSSSKAANH